MAYGVWRMASRARIPARLTAGCNMKAALVQYAARRLTGNYFNARKLAEVKDKSGPPYSHRPLSFQYLLQWPKIRKPSRNFFWSRTSSLSPSGAGHYVMWLFRKLGICMGHSVDSSGVGRVCVCACVCLCVWPRTFNKAQNMSAMFCRTVAKSSVSMGGHLGYRYHRANIAPTIGLLTLFACFFSFDCAGGRFLNLQLCRT